jgi:hypothetical protein
MDEESPEEDVTSGNYTLTPAKLLFYIFNWWCNEAETRPKKAKSETKQPLGDYYRDFYFFTCRMQHRNYGSASTQRLVSGHTLNTCYLYYFQFDTDGQRKKQKCWG